jgi:hypothetical protein
MTDLNNSSYYKKFNDYTEELKNKMYIFEVSKCCGYSTFVMVYKEQSVNELYLNIFHHFGRNQIVSLYLLDKDDNKIPLSDMLNKTIRELIEDNILMPIYAFPLQVVYRVYLDDGHLHSH